MKKILYIVFIISLVYSCGTAQKTTVRSDDTKKVDIQSANEEEEEEYILLTFDMGFESWYDIHKASAEMHSINYFKNWNIRYVNDWNMRSRSISESKYFNMTLDFDPFDYDDLELQRKLFMYFQYVEKELKLKILFGPSPSFII